MNTLNSLGGRIVGAAAVSSRIAAVAVGALRLLVDPRSWSVSVRRVFMNQVYFSGVQALRLVVSLAVLCGIAVVLQVQVWLVNIGQSGLTGDVLVQFVFRGLAPVMVGFILIGRSGTAICAELAGMRNRGEIDVLEAQGVDTLTYLVMPRSSALAISCFSLSMIFVVVAILTGWLAGVLGGSTDASLPRFLGAVLLELRPAGALDFLLKTVVGGLLIGAIACYEGLATSGLSTEVPQAVTRGVVLSMSAFLIVYGVITLMLYGQS